MTKDEAFARYCEGLFGRPPVDLDGDAPKRNLLVTLFEIDVFQDPAWDAGPPNPRDAALSQSSAPIKAPTD